MRFSKVIFSLAMACIAAAPAWAVKLQNVTVNGVAYTENMPAPASDVLTLAGTIVIDALDDFNYWYLPSSGREPYPGVGFFAAGTDSCMVLSPSGLLTTPVNPDAQIYWPDPARCIPNFSISGNILSTTTDVSFPLTMKFNQSTGAFSGLQIPVAAYANKNFSITYQLNHWSWDLNSSNPNAIWPSTASLASLRWNTAAVQYFKPQVELKFGPASDQCTRKLTGTASNANTSLTILASLVPACTDVAGNQKLWVAAYLPNNGLYFKKNDGTWTILAGSDTATIDAAAYSTGNQLPLSLAIIDHLDASTLVGADVYIGYGSDAADMLNNKKQALIYQIR